VQRVAIVTGGATGIGRALSTGLAADGMAVVVGWHGNEAGARDTLRAIETAGGRATLVQGDIAELATADRLVEAAVSAYGRLDVMCAHAPAWLRAWLADIVGAHPRLGGLLAEQVFRVVRARLERRAARQRRLAFLEDGRIGDALSFSGSME